MNPSAVVPGVRYRATGAGVRVVYQDGARIHYPDGAVFTIRASASVVKIDGTAVPMQADANPLEQKSA